MGVLEIVVIAVVVAGAVIALFGWDRYRGRRATSSGTFHPTDEVFVDPESGQRTRVWYDAASGRREYRPE